MDEHEASCRSAEQRLERAVLNIDELLNSGPIAEDRFAGSITRVVIAMNTLAQALQGRPDDAASAKIADLLWSFGERLGIDADGARR